MVSISDFESDHLGSNPSKTFLICIIKILIIKILITPFNISNADIFNYYFIYNN